MMCNFVKNHKKSIFIFLLGVISAIAAIFVVKKKMTEPVIDEAEALDYEGLDFEEACGNE